MTLTLALATTIAQAALEAGAREDVHALSVVVTDTGGVIRVAMRGDAVGLFGIDIALAKATTALGFNRSSMQIAKSLGTNPAATAGLVGATSGRFMPIGGGVIIVDDAGKIIGAAAVAGSAPENDERFVIEGVRAAGFQVPD